MLKSVMEIGTCSKNPIIPEIRDSIITVKDVKVFILRKEIPEAFPQQAQLSPPQLQQPQLHPPQLQFEQSVHSSQQPWQQSSQQF